MLAEIPGVRQVPGEGRRRWFADNYFDLIVWYDGDVPVGFQLCYDKHHHERALTWRPPSSFSHLRVDDGEGAMAGPKMTPVLVQDGAFDAGAVIDRFRGAAAAVDPGIVDMVVGALSRYPAHPPPGSGQGTGGLAAS